jgi:anthranilate phosphoribosyltransferase
MIKEAIAKLVKGESLGQVEAAATMEQIMTGEATQAQVGSFLTALRIKGETVEEIAGMAQVMRDKALHVFIPEDIDAPVVDTCGTGGDGSNTFNISTTASFVVAGAGAVVAKHGNRAASSRCGSADILESLGVKIELKPEQVSRCLHEAGIGFMYAVAFHPSMKYVGPVRREVGIRTVFNFLGPLTNPARVQRQVLGVPNAELAHKLAAVLKLLGSTHSLVVHSSDGLDEISIAAPSHVYEVVATDKEASYNIELREMVIQPEDFGLARAPFSAMLGGSVEENKTITLQVLAGALGPHRDVVLLNSAAALVAAGIANTLQQGVQQAAHAIDSGEAMRRLHALVEVSHKV